jgi:uroporphyrin-III C-methyltransferase/precorrin-2 dehydrogenase/sirohydrochlorin ferrochelatase
MKASGFVSLVGAGPGSADLLTLAAARRLAEADLVLHDALVSPEVLALATGAIRVSVGKRAGRPSASQESIHRLMARAAKRGRRVVRLKGGDPFVFGRGGEEALALTAAGVPFEIVPGISAALAAPALSGIPVTHRGLSSSFLVVSGHAETAYRPVLSAIPPQSTTIVVLMGLGKRRDISSLLISTGWSPETPAAVCLGASTAEACTWIGRLAELDESGDQNESAGTIVIGDVVNLGRLIGQKDQDEPAPMESERHRASQR